ncbi:cytochrome c [Paenibacillus sp. YYML68]|uniref:c-type cytochrome n=1 Tax=Paenibacillus sp. YYML68 TaxID=2909250 RepID=UPI0024912E16|nr:cytochrome c [Paenibacillus sp. YYML68]
MKVTPWKLSAACGLLTLALLTGCTAKESPEPFGGGKTSAVTPETAMAGASESVQALYKQNCLSCHAANLEGRMGGKTNLQQVGARLSVEQITTQIAKGGNGMPGYQGRLKPEEIDGLAQWLATKK